MVAGLCQHFATKARKRKHRKDFVHLCILCALVVQIDVEVNYTAPVYDLYDYRCRLQRLPKRFPTDDYQKTFIKKAAPIYRGRFIFLINSPYATFYHKKWFMLL
jgi:hypothetical protein